MRNRICRVTKKKKGCNVPCSSYPEIGHHPSERPRYASSIRCRCSLSTISIIVTTITRAAKSPLHWSTPSTAAQSPRPMASQARQVARVFLTKSETVYSIHCDAKKLLSFDSYPIPSPITAFFGIPFPLVLSALFFPPKGKFHRLGGFAARRLPLSAPSFFALIPKSWSAPLIMSQIS